MRTLTLLAVSLLCGCSSGGRALYEPCDAQEAGALGCAEGCAAGGVGCAQPEAVAARCLTQGPTQWTLEFSCASCVERESGSVSCGDSGVDVAVYQASCTGGTACTTDLQTSLRCSDGRFIISEHCASGKTCGAVDGGFGCR